MCNTLYLPLNKKWFDMIKSGEKKEEYREIKPFYINRFIKFKPLKIDLINDYKKGFDEGEINGMENELIITSKKFKNVIFTLAYPSTEEKDRRIEFNNPKIHVGEGKIKWGAEPGKKYFVITWDN